LLGGGVDQATSFDLSGLKLDSRSLDRCLTPWWHLACDRAGRSPLWYRRTEL